MVVITTRERDPLLISLMYGAEFSLMTSPVGLADFPLVTYSACFGSMPCCFQPYWDSYVWR